MIWAAIGLNFKSKLILIEGSVNSCSYVKMILDNDIFPSLAEAFVPSGFLFQQDNAKPHISIYTSKWFFLMRIPMAPKWPAKSPDLSLIEQVWKLLKERPDLTSISSPEDLDQAILRAWDSITLDEINNFVASFQTRLETCIELAGESLNGHWKNVHEKHHRFNGQEHDK
jgi:hypothetical protein